MGGEFFRALSHPMGAPAWLRNRAEGIGSTARRLEALDPENAFPPCPNSHAQAGDRLPDRAAFCSNGVGGLIRHQPAVSGL